MADDGVAPQPTIAPGAADILKLQHGGYTNDEILQYKTYTTAKLRAGKYSQDDIDQYWGDQKPSTAAIDALHSANPAIHEAKDPLDMFVAGLQMSDIGLALHGKPTTLAPENAGMAGTIANALGQAAGDFPASVAGFFAGGLGGGAAGAAVPGAGETGISEAAGATLGAGAGMNAVPQAIREVLLDGYEKGENRTWPEFWAAVSAASWRIAKSGAVGAATNLVAGKIAGPLVDAGLKPWLAKGADLGAQAVTATTVGAALNGRVPEAKDFIAGAVTMLTLSGAAHLAGGFKNPQQFVASEAGRRVQANLQEIYRQTGVPPWIAVKLAASSPGIRDEILAQDVNGKPVITNLRASAPDEPPLPGKAGETTGPIKDPVEDLLPKVRGLEASGDNAISPKGAVGRYQIMPGTARQYGFDPSRLTDPAYNEMVARHVLSDLNRRFRGDEDAILTAYNAGPGRAAALLKAGPGTALEAEHGPHGWTYTRVAAQRSEAGLPLETQEYLARSRKGPPEPPAGGGGGGEGPPPKLPAPEEGEDPFKLDTGIRVDRFLDRIGEPSTAHRPMLTGFEMELDAARGVDNELRTRGLLDPKGVGIEDMARSTYASENRADHFFFKGPIDPLTFEPKQGTSLKDVADAIKDVGGNKDEFNAYRVSMRTIEKARQGVDVGVIPLKEAEANAADPNLQKYAKIDKMMQDFKHGVLEYVRDSGGISQKQLDAMEAANTSHVSLRRIMGDDAPFAPKGTRRGFRAVNPIARMEGSDRKIVDPWTADIDNARLMIRFADRNRAAGAVVGAQEGIPAALDVMRLAPAEAKATLAEPGSSTFKPYGMNDKEAEALAPFVTQTKGGDNSTRFTFWRDGKPEVYEAKDPNLARLYRGADSPAEATWISRIGQLPAKLERSGIVLDPTFPVRVTERHQIAAFMADPLHPPPFITTLRGILHVWGKSDEFWDFAAHGGLSGSIVDMDKNMLKSDAQKLLDETGVNNKLWNFVRHPIEAVQMFSDRMSQSSRLGYYKMATGRGVEPFKAAMMSRKAYLDYDEKFVSDELSRWAKYVPFFKADVLGLKQFGAAAFSTNRAANFAAYITVGLVTPQIAMYLANRHADKSLPPGKRYTDIPQWERDNYFITPPIDGIRIRIGKPYVSGPLFGVPLERFLEHTYENDPHAWDDAAGAMMEPLPLSLPSAVRPAIEHIADHNFFTGRPLIPDSLKDASPDLQYTEATSKPAIALAALLGPHHKGLNWANVSPIVLDNYVRSWTGAVGTAALRAVGGAFGSGGEKPWEMSDLPFVGSFFVRNPGTGSKPIEDYYADLKKFETAHANITLAYERQDMSVLQQDMQNATLYGRMKNISGALKIMRDMVQETNNNTKMSPDEKRQATDRIVSDMIGISQAGSQALRSVK